MRIGALSGSLGPGSANAAALTTARHAIRSSANRGAEGVEVVDVVGLDTVPPFRPDRVDDPSPEVASFRAQVEGVDGLLVAAPEYAGGLAGVVKNALDWLVGSASLYRRCVAVLSAGTTGGVFAIDQLVRTLSWQGALVVATLGIDGARTKRDASGAFVDGATVDAITRWANELVAGCTEDLPAQIARTEPILRRHGVDPARHGEG